MVTGERFYGKAYKPAYMGDTSIRLSEDAKARLDLYKRAGESYEDVILRLTERDPWAGFGALADTDGETRDGMAQIREEMRTGIAEDLDDGT
jgi:predicted CopG family antitoxin